ncbi:MAG: nSTAND1 domain-containing NTPase [Anaerolineales bacterium]
MSTEQSFGQLVKARRRELGLTQDELARRVGCAPVTIRKIEYDDLRPSVQIAERLAMALNIPLEERAAFVRLARVERHLEPETSATPAPRREEIGLEDLTGRAIRGYALAERIGDGGMGVVYRAVQPLVEREVAVKIILPQYADHPDFIRRFEAEAQLVARLEHPHIVPLYDYWREPGSAYLVMRLLRGGSVLALLKDGPLPLEAAFRLLEQIASALSAAHRIGIVHRDLKPANVLLDEDRNGYLADFGIAKNLGNPNLADQTQAEMLIGSPAYISPEQIRAESVRPQSDIYALGVMLYELLTGALPFQGPTPIEVMHQHLNAPLPPLAAHRAGLPAALDGVIAKATAKNLHERYPDVDALLKDMRHALGRDGQRLTPSASQVAALSQPLPDDANPYKGLRAFGEADTQDFFGREALTQQLLARLGEGGDLIRFLAVVGPSGSGKSSVVKAGLIPALRRGGLPGSDQWFIVEMMPGPHPLEEIEAALLRIAVNPPETLSHQLREDKRGLLRAVRRCLPDDPNVELVMVIDQFEEVFTLVEDEAVRAHLLDSLVAAVMDERSRVRVVVTLRADFTHRPLHYVDFGELLRQRMEVILPMTPDELERAIAGPAERVGLALDSGLVSAIIRDVGDQPGALPLLQYALTELFARREGRLLTKKAYAEIGGVLGALGRRAEDVYTGLNEGGQALARQLFLRLVTIGEGTEDTRRRVLRAELDSLSGEISNPQSLIPNSLIPNVIDSFGRSRLLTFDRDPVTRGPTVEVAHEALLREWPRLRAWLNESRADVRLQRLLAGAVAEWMAADREPSFLLTGARLDQFEGWAAQSTLALTQDERAYLDASLAERDRKQVEEAERTQRELDLARKSETAQRTSANRLRYLVGALTIFLLVAIGLSAFAFIQQSRAEREARLSTSRELAAAAVNVIGADPERSILLALEAVTTTRSIDGTVAPEAEEALHRTVASAQSYFVLNGHDGIVNDVAFSPEGTRLATASFDGTTKVWDAATGHELLTLAPADRTETAAGHGDHGGETSEEPAGAAYTVAFSPDGNQIAAAGQDGVVTVWESATGHLLFALSEVSPTEASSVTAISAIEFSGSSGKCR